MVPGGGSTYIQCKYYFFSISYLVFSYYFIYDGTLCFGYFLPMRTLCEACHKESISLAFNPGHILVAGGVNLRSYIH